MKIKLAMIILAILLFTSSFAIAQDTLYYPTNYEYPGANLLVSDLNTSTYYYRDNILQPLHANTGIWGFYFYSAADVLATADKKVDVSNRRDVNDILFGRRYARVNEVGSGEIEIEIKGYEPSGYPDHLESDQDRIMYKQAYIEKRTVFYTNRGFSEANAKERAKQDADNILDNPDALPYDVAIDVRDTRYHRKIENGYYTLNMTFYESRIDDYILNSTLTAGEFQPRAYEIDTVIIDFVLSNNNPNVFSSSFRRNGITYIIEGYFNLDFNYINGSIYPIRLDEVYQKIRELETKGQLTIAEQTELHRLRLEFSKLRQKEIVLWRASMWSSESVSDDEKIAVELFKDTTDRTLRGINVLGYNRNISEFEGKYGQRYSEARKIEMRRNGDVETITSIRNMPKPSTNVNWTVHKLVKGNQLIEDVNLVVEIREEAGPKYSITKFELEATTQAAQNALGWKTAKFEGENAHLLVPKYGRWTFSNLVVKTYDANGDEVGTQAFNGSYRRNVDWLEGTWINTWAAKPRVGAAVDPDPEPEPAAVDPDPEPEPAAVDPDPEPEPAVVEPATIDLAAVAAGNWTGAGIARETDNPIIIIRMNKKEDGSYEITRFRITIEGGTVFDQADANNAPVNITKTEDGKWKFSGLTFDTSLGGDPTESITLSGTFNKDGNKIEGKWIRGERERERDWSATKD